MAEGPENALSGNMDLISGEETNRTREQDDSETDDELVEESGFLRRVSTNKDKRLNKTVCLKEGYLLIQSRTALQKMKRRYFWLKGRILYSGRDNTAELLEEIDLTGASVAEYNLKNVQHSFQIISMFSNVVLAVESRKELESWIHCISSCVKQQYCDPLDCHSMIDGSHSWYITSHARPVYCNVCKDALSGVTSHGLSCAVCKFKTHKRCAVNAPNNCKWATLANIGDKIIEESDGSLGMEHQWLIGNLPVSAHCTVCDKSCGSVRRLQDMKCLWCKAMVHTGCVNKLSRQCSLALCRLSVLPPFSIHSIDADGLCEASKARGHSPLLVFVNSKSGDNQGVKFLRRFRQLLNPAQVFDLMNGGPNPGLRLFRSYQQFRILICGGDGSVGWVLTELDKFDPPLQGQIGVLPLGTGNDLARVLGWGSVLHDDTQLQTIIEKLEQSQIKMLDRWSILTYEWKQPRPYSNPSTADAQESTLNNPKTTSSAADITDPMTKYEHSITSCLHKILNSGDDLTVLSSARNLCGMVSLFLSELVQMYDLESDEGKSEDSIQAKCQLLKSKLDNLQNALAQTEQNVPHEGASSTREESPERKSGGKSRRKSPKPEKPTEGEFVPTELLMSRANSVKKAVKNILEHTQLAVDTLAQESQPESERDADTTAEVSSPDSEPYTPHSVTPRTVTFDVLPTESGTRDSSSAVTTNPNTAAMNLRVSLASPLSSGQVSPAANESAGGGVGTGTSALRVNKSIASSINTTGFIGKMLLANADAICAAIVPKFDESSLMSEVEERAVMNNYFGIGIDAKIMLEFHQQRDEHPERFRSRARNLMTFVNLGGREIVTQTYRNFERRIALECDGQNLPLPQIQGIVILNIPSYSGGTNFWGTHRGSNSKPFTKPSFDDRVLEVMAVYGSAHIGVSKFVNLQYHRIAQCQTIKITILGDEPVPVQVDGEAWLQNPGFIRVQHKNRAQMLTRDRAFEQTLKNWSDMQKTNQIPTSPNSSVRGSAKQTQLMNQSSSTSNSNNTTNLQNLVGSTQLLVDCLTSTDLPAVSATEDALRKVGEFVSLHDATQTGLKELSLCATELCSEVMGMLSAAEETCSELDMSQIKKALNETQEQLELHTGLPGPSSGYLPKQQKQGPFRLIGRLLHRRKNRKSPESSFTSSSRGSGPSHSSSILMADATIDTSSPESVGGWSSRNVATWLASIGLGEYSQLFIKNDIRGTELVTLQKSDLKELGVTKVGHLKRLQASIKHLSPKSGEKVLSL